MKGFEYGSFKCKGSFALRHKKSMENGNMKGHWIGIFTEKDNGTEIDFTEDVTAKKLLMKPFIKAYLKRQQAQYISDLKRALSTR